MISSTFSIDYLTSKVNRCGGEDSLRRSPVPSLSNSSSGTESENPESIVKVLLSLDKTMKSNIGDATDGKPAQSYIALISMAILSSPNQKMLLCDIYQYIMDNFRFYNNTNKAWRNSIRHNLSLNECFVKSGRSENGKGNYWSIHPACIEDFSRGDFRRRQARRRARKSMKEVDAVMSSIKGRMNSMIYVPMTSSAVGYHNQLPYSYTQNGFSDVCGSSIAPPTSTPSFFQQTSPELHRLPHPSQSQNMAAW
ncbi:forkhead box protein E4-like [Mizuhopecten yessoensis]|uniref:Forkhead box protein L1 n=1 Tax=Mizuhopecten yessoensis TaxID=6573 RepID=A0A210QE01_MIZYE|nr:forkhead box protein E4-like [Mizuhopecten yessoensis]OWF46946.1 Forkhead box protein L1 [Mizuhopecten yessoensis]